MRRTRPLLLLAILGVLAAVAVSYYIRRNAQENEAPPAPKSLPADTSAAASDWRWSKSEGSRPVVEVRAGSFRQVKEPSQFDLQRVELRIFDKQGKTFDEVKSANAQFDIQKGVLYSEGEVQITTGMATDGNAPGRLVFIRSSGVTFDSKTGKVSTERPAFFRFENGEGKCTGAYYDPATRELQMLSEADVTWRGHAARSKPMRVEAGQLTYRESDSAIILSPWSRLTREDMVLNAGEAFVFLNKGNIERVEATAAKGKEQDSAREVEYAADHLTMRFSDSGTMEKILGEPNARLSSVSGTGRTTVNTDRLEMDFEPSGGESLLRKALAMGHSVVESRPRPGRKGQPETRVLRSDVIQLDMQPDGKEIRAVETHTPGTLEFLPNQPDQNRRRLEAERMWIAYGDNNRIRSFRAVNVSTRTEPPASAGKKPAPPSVTSSKLLLAGFDPESGELNRLEQSDTFRYEQGDRKGKANRAVLDQPKDLITLEGSARLWDPAGATSADKIVLHQKTDDVTAEGNVASTRQPERQKNSGVMLSEDKPLQAKAARMTTRDGKKVVVYEGHAVLWQGADRIEGDWIQIDRTKRQLIAKGNVRTQLVEEPKSTAGKDKDQEGRSPVYTIVEASELDYDDTSRLAHYTGGVKLVRAEARVKAADLRAYLKKSDSGTELEKAYADGNVEIVHASPDRTRKGLGEHAEYYTGEEKIVLYGGQPVLEDSLRGSTKGTRLTWFANNDRLLVDGKAGQPSVSRIYRK